VDTIKTSVLVYGAGGFGREAAWLAEQCGVTVLGFVDDNEASGRRLNGRSVMTLGAAKQMYPGAAVVPAMGSGASREQATARSCAPAASSRRTSHWDASCR
jgi:D-arabinose 1-dehydrogenase-like Zn-dependent alcohol dehydrogenase